MWKLLRTMSGERLEVVVVVDRWCGWALVCESASIAVYDPPVSAIKGHQFSMHAGLPRPRPWCQGADHLEVRGEQAKELGATCHIFRDIDVFGAFPMVPLVRGGHLHAFDRRCAQHRLVWRALHSGREALSTQGWVWVWSWDGEG